MGDWVKVYVAAGLGAAPEERDESEGRGAVFICLAPLDNCTCGFGVIII